MQVFLILSDPDVVLPLAYVILTWDTSLSLPPVLTQTNSVSNWPSVYGVKKIMVIIFQCQRKENTVPQFAPPVVRLDQEVSLRQPVYVPAMAPRPRSHRLGWRRRGEDGEGSSTESHADLQDELSG